MIPALRAAYYIINQCNARGVSISNLKLQKIMYFVQGQFLVSTGGPCFPEDIEARDYGPVVSKVYTKFRVYGGASIPYQGAAEPLTEGDMAIIDMVLDHCAHYSATMLLKITLRQTPWKISYRQGENAVIPTEAIREFFEEDDNDSDS